MRKQSLSDFEAQIFRRIGYTVGLWNLLGFEAVCRPLHAAGSLDEEVLVRRVRETLIVQKSSSKNGDDEANQLEAPTQNKDTLHARRKEPLDNSARGKIDVAKALGLIQSPPNFKRYALTAHGRALLAIKSLSDAPNVAVQAFYLWRVLESDSDQFLTLFTILSVAQQDYDLDVEIPQRLDRLLKMKFDVCTHSSLPNIVKQRLDEILRIRDSKPLSKTINSISGRSEKRLRLDQTRIHIQGAGIANYVRHTAGPRKGWLLDLSLMEKRDDGTYVCTLFAKRLTEYLLSHRCYQDGLPIIQPDDVVLLDLIGSDTLFPSAPVNFRFFMELLSYTYHGVPLKRVDLPPGEFLDGIEEIYSLVKLERFQQAETTAIRESLAILRAVKGEWIDFDQLLDASVRAFPQKIALLSSTRARGAYIMLKGATK
jgi:hypothetical protein